MYMLYITHKTLYYFYLLAWNQVNTRQRSESSDGSDCSEPSSKSNLTIVYVRYIYNIFI